MYEKLLVKKLAKKKNIVKYKRPIRLNIGILVFLFILVYFIFGVFSYLFKTHVSSYEVQKGQLAANMTYTGIAIREENEVLASDDGYINYYLGDGSKAGKGDALFSIDESKVYYDEITSNSSDTSSITQETLDSIAESVNKYTTTYDDNTFSSVYAQKSLINGTLTETINSTYLKELIDSGNVDDSVFHLTYAKKAGVITYWTDGYEDLTAETFTPDCLNTHDYTKVTYLSNDEVSNGNAIGKLVTSELWQIIIPVDDDIVEELSEDTNVKVYFTKDSTTAWAEFEVLDYSGKKYLLLNLKNSMIRFVDERYVSLKLIISRNSGLKIPNTAIVEKEFYTIPKEYFYKGGDSGNLGLMVRDKESGEESFVATTVYYKKAKLYYIDMDDFPESFEIIKPDSAEVLSSPETASLKGVYNINKGFAVFKQIDITASNEEYSIVAENTDYGLNIYDHIALNGDSIEEGELVN